MQRKALEQWKTWSWAGLIVILNLVFSVQASAAVSNTEVRELLQVSGFVEAMENLPEAFRSGIQESVGSDPAISGEQLNRVTKKFNQVFSVEELIGQAEKDLIETLRRDQLSQLMEWYRSDLGRRITRAEVASSTSDAYQEMFGSAQELMSDMERVAMAKQIDTLAGITDFGLNVQTSITEAIMQAVQVKLDSEEERRAFEEQFRNQMAMAERQMKAQVEQMTTLSLVYSYRNIPKDDLEQYIEFLSTDAARNYSRDLMRSMETGFGDVMTEYANALTEQRPAE